MSYRKALPLIAAACEIVAFRHVMKLHQWYEESCSNICYFLDPFAREVLSHHFYHFLALYFRPSLWISTNSDSLRGDRSMIETLFWPSAMVLTRSRNGGRYVSIFKHPLEFCITTAVRIDRYSKLIGHVDISGCWETIFEGHWKCLELFTWLPVYNVDLTRP